LAGCSATPFISGTPTAPSTTLSPEASAPVDAALTAEDSYRLCVDKEADATAEAFGGTRDQISNAPFADSWVVDRCDGSFFVWSDQENGMAPAELVSVGATTCVVGGTVGNAECSELAGSGALIPFIGQSHPMEDAATSHRHVETGHKAGSAVMTLGR